MTREGYAWWRQSVHWGWQLEHSDGRLGMESREAWMVNRGWGETVSLDKLTTVGSEGKERNEAVIGWPIGINEGFFKGKDTEHVCGLMDVILCRMWGINNTGGKEEKLKEKAPEKHLRRCKEREPWAQMAELVLDRRVFVSGGNVGISFCQYLLKPDVLHFFLPSSNL